MYGLQPECGGVGAGLDVAASQGTGCSQRATHAALPSPRDAQRSAAGSDDEGKDGTREHADGDVWTCDEAWRRERMHARQGSNVRDAIVMPSNGATGKRGSARGGLRTTQSSLPNRHPKPRLSHTARSHIILKRFPHVYISNEASLPNRAAT